MKKTGRNMLAGVIFLSALCGFFMNANVAFSGMDQLIKIQPVGEDKLVGMFIDPPVVYVERNAIIIWLSGIVSDEVQVIFEEGKTCQDVTANPWGFELKTLGNRDCYVTNFLKFGETSSLQFSQAGTFQYKVVTLDGKVKASGKIMVRF